MTARGRPSRLAVRVSWAALVAGAALAPACHHKGTSRDPDDFIGRAQATSTRKTTPAGDARLPPPLRSYAVATVPDRSVGPFLARGGGVAMGAYLGPGDGGTRRVVSIPMASDGAPKQSRVVAPTLADSTTLVLRPAGGDHGGFIAAWTELTDRGEALAITGLGPDGAAVIPPIELARTNDDIVWVDVTPTARGEICVWAEETKSNDANILAVALDPSGKPRGVPSRVAKGVTAWQVVSTVAGAGVALVSNAAAPAPPATGARPATGSRVDWLKLDADARPVGPVTPVGASAAKITDIDLARVRDTVVFAWTDRSDSDPAVWLAAIDGEGKPSPAHAVTGRSGGAKLSAIGGGKTSGLLAWEESRRRPRPQRRLHVARIDEAGALAAGDAGTVIEADTSGVPEISALDSGFAVLVRARTCADPPSPGDPPCSEAVAVPLLLRLDLASRVVETEPVRIDEGQEVATLAWGLSCEEQQCLVLAAGQESPAKIRAVSFTEMPNRWRAPVPPSPPPGAPRVVAVETLQSGDLFADVAVAPTDEGALVAAVTSAAEEPGQGGGRGATVSVRALDPTGAPRGAAQTLTKRALSVGGVAIAAAPKADGAAVGWLAREGGKAQVHVSRVDRAGRRTKDVQLTTSPGETTEVALAWAGGGWVVAWVDTRDGNGEVYATKVDGDLNRIAREERITSAPGDASDIVLIGHGAAGGDVALAWADPRESPKDGFADVFTARLSGVSAKPVVPEARVLPTAAHSRSPALAWGEAGRLDVAWIEEAPMSSGSDNSGAYGALVGSLDDRGHLAGDLVKTHGAGEGYPTSVALERTGGVLRVVLARAARDDLSLDVLEIGRDRETPPSLLYVLDGPPSLDVSLSLVGGALFFNDEGVEVGDGRVRRVSASWGK